MRKPPREIASIFGQDGNITYDKEELITLDCKALSPYPNHHFKPYSEIKMQKMVDSIKTVGVLQPIIVLQEDNKYYILAGHNRVQACNIAGIKQIKAIVKKDLTELQQVEIVNFTNFFQRGDKNFLLSELIQAYKHEYDALIEDRKNNKSEFDGNATRKYLADLYDITDSDMQRYLSLSKLIPELLDCLDFGKINKSVALVFSSMSEDSQLRVYKYILSVKTKMKIKEAKMMKEQVEKGEPINTSIDLKNADVSLKSNQKKSSNINLKILDWFKEHNLEICENSVELIIPFLNKLYEEAPNLLNILIKDI